MIPTILLSSDGAMYRIAYGVRPSRCWMATAKADKAKTIPEHRRFAGFIDVETRQGGRYARAVFALDPHEVDCAEQRPISKRSHKFKDYAAFHRWPG